MSMLSITRDKAEQKHRECLNLLDDICKDTNTFKHWKRKLTDDWNACDSITEDILNDKNYLWVTSLIRGNTNKHILKRIAFRNSISNLTALRAKISKLEHKELNNLQKEAKNNQPD